MDLLDKLNERLLRAISAAGEDSFPGGLTVADVYQRLIPYRAVRGQLGVAELAEYEHAMLRLLSGERQYLEVVDPDIRIEIQRELASLNPILGIYRDYSGAQIRLADGAGGVMDAPRTVTPAVATPESRAPDPEPESSDDEVDLPVTGLELLRPSRGPRAVPHDWSGMIDPRSAQNTCGGCGLELPDLPDVRFCPFCGLEQGPAPCARCGAPMDRAWHFCTRCGSGRGGTSP